MSQLTFKVEGMSCNHCVATIENSLKQLGAVGRVNLVDKSVQIDYEETSLDINSLKEAIEIKGFDVVSSFTVVDGVPAGVIALMDTLKASTPQAIRRLKKMGIVVAMVTGDHLKTANAIAEKAGITAIYAEMMPQDKVHLVRMLQQKGRRVAMVGDGVNDAPALAAADIGIAVGTGSEIAKEAADVNLLHSDLGGVADAMVMSRKTMRNIRQNLMFALMYNVLAIPLAFMGLMTPWIAGTAMALSSVSVVANASRLQKATWRN